MQREISWSKLLFLVFSSLMTLALPILVMGAVWNFLFTEYWVTVLVFLGAGIVSFAVGTVLFWRLALYLRLRREDA